MRVARARARRPCSARASSSTPTSRSTAHERARPDLPGVLSAARSGEQRRDRSPTLQLPTGHDPVVRRRPLRPVEPRRDGDGARRRRTPRPRRAGLRVARRHPAPRRQLVELLPARRLGRGGQARHQRVRVHRHRRVAPLAVHLGPGFVDHLWPTVQRALDWVLGLRARRRHGAVGGAPTTSAPWDYALLTGSASIAHALRCGGAAGRRSSTNHARTGATPPIALAHVVADAARGVRAEGRGGRWTGTTRCSPAR